MLKIVCIVGARPNFVKIPSLIKEFKAASSISSYLVHTGQHYDGFMSDVFFSDLYIEKPDVFFGVGAGTPIWQIANIMIKGEEYLKELEPDLMVVVGDVNSTLAMSLVGKKMGIPVAHVEAGLRSRNWLMPEESNRVLTDRLSELLFTPTEEDTQNLLDEGIDKDKIFMVGNIMIDSLLINIEKAPDREVILKKLNISAASYSLVTLHRPECVDNKEQLSNVISAFDKIQGEVSIIWPIHPRTRKNLSEFGLLERLNKMPDLTLLEPLGYLEFLSLMKNALFVMTDSGGIQEETTVLNVPCLTLREETERPITVTQGTNEVVGLAEKNIIEAAIDLIGGKKMESKIPKYWDGNTSKRIVKRILEWKEK